MKKISLMVLLSFSFILNGYSQIILGSGDFPYAGLNLKYYQAFDSSGALDALVTIGNPGANGIYDVSGILPNINDTMDVCYKAPANTPFPTQHPSSNLALYWRTFFVLGDTAAWLWNYYNVTATSLTLNGVSVIVDTLYFANLTHGTHQYLSPPLSKNLEVLSSNYVMGYTYKDSTFSKICILSNPSLVVAAKVKTDVHVDGWGTLTTPKGVYDVLRVKQIYIQADAFIPAADTVNPIDYPEAEKFYQYVYFGKGIGDAVAVINMDSTFTHVISVYYVNLAPQNVNEISSQNDFRLFPNLTSDIINIEKKGKNIDNAEINIYDITGRLVMNKTVNKAYSTIKLEVDNLGKGTYILQLQTTNEIFKGKFVKN